MAQVSYLFVYGTLRSQAVNPPAELLRNSAQLVSTGKVNGRLYSISGYPGLLPSEDGDEWVVGDVYELPNPEILYRQLDDYEGCGPSDPQPHEYRRVSLPALLESGDWIMATTYVYQWSIEGRARISSGDFFAEY